VVAPPEKEDARPTSRWPGDGDLLVRELEGRCGPAWPQDCQRRRNLLDALTRGLAPASS